MIGNGEKVEEGERVEGTGEGTGEAETEQGGVGSREAQKWRKKRERESELRGDPEGQRIWDGGGEETGMMEE